MKWISVEKLPQNTVVWLWGEGWLCPLLGIKDDGFYLYSPRGLYDMIRDFPTHYHEANPPDPPEGSP